MAQTQKANQINSNSCYIYGHHYFPAFSRAYAKENFNIRPDLSQIYNTNPHFQHPKKKLSSTTNYKILHLTQSTQELYPRTARSLPVLVLLDQDNHNVHNPETKQHLQKKELRVEQREMLTQDRVCERRRGGEGERLTAVESGRL
jgi:RecG-like helicase